MLQRLTQTRQNIYARTHNFINRHGRHLPMAAFVWGFIWDNLTLTRVGLLFDNIVIFSYLVISLSSIVLINLFDTGRYRNERTERLGLWLPLIMQFAFGNLFSAYFVYYSRSGSLGAGWIFVAFLALLWVGNEFFKKRYQRLTMQLTIFFVTFYTFTIFYLPIVVASIKTWVFVLSGILSLVMIVMIVLGLSKIFPERVRKSRTSLSLSIGAIYVLFNFFYFVNLIPPLPLALREVGIFHSVLRDSEGNYVVEYEPAPWYRFFSRESSAYNYEPGESAYCFSSVFAPTRLTTNIMHRWQYYDTQKKQWTTESVIGYRINGGRDEGYRGYTIKQNLREGRWRCDVVTERGALIGRVKFEVARVDSEQERILEREEI